MQGRRIPFNPDKLCDPGDFYKDDVGDWRGQTPNGLYIWLKNHHVEEHDDGMISVLPGGGGSSNSILAKGTQDHEPWDKVEWHGYIYHGVWRTC